MLIINRFILAALLVASPAAAYAQKTFGLVIGINKYQYVPKLDGAVADATDIATALDGNGVDRLITLTDQDATKDNIEKSWQSLLSEAQSGDTIVLSYAGHGSQAPEQIQGEEEDKLDEFWVLPGFNPDDIPGTWRQTVFDNELHSWFTEASNKGIRVTFVSDSCHAGGMDRSIRAKMRYVDISKSRFLDKLTAFVFGSDETPVVKENALPANITMLAATAENLQVPELVIDGRLRGALSWSVARAFEGKADVNDDGLISRTELEDYVLPIVRLRSEALQTPVFTPFEVASGLEILLPLRRNQGSQTISFPKIETGKQGRPTARDLGFTGILPVNVKGKADQPAGTIPSAFGYEWDVQTAVFKNSVGDVVAENVTQANIAKVVGKFILLDYLSRLSTLHTGFAEIFPVHQVYLAKDRIHFNYHSKSYRNFVVFNLANNGEVQFIDMVTDGKPAAKTPLRQMEITAPFGADHLIILASHEKIEAVGSKIQHGIDTKSLIEQLKKVSSANNTEVTVVPIYSRAY